MKGIQNLVFFFGVLCKSDALDCYTCTNATYVSECTATKTCNTGEECITVIQNGNNIGGGSIVGRSGVTGPCSECCIEQHCNRQLCQHAFSAKECVDNTGIQCPTVGALVNMCSDKEKASTICRRFCGLCDLVNGEWSSWFSWSSCDVTCGSGIRTRTRTCSDPAPSGDGQYCIGASQDTKVCTFEPCPIHGYWAEWASWGKCDATCGIGLRRRDRTCSNPHPARFGDNCYGDSRDNTVCLASECADGGWSSWVTWSACSRTCGDGIRTRSRSCDNPLPSILGKYCNGNPYQVETCNMMSCPVTNGGWGLWADLSSCTASCNVGMQSRLRHCNNPKPSADADFCDGSASDVQLCNQHKCPRSKASFLVYDASRGGDGVLRFTTIYLNEGSVYNQMTGEFTCQFPGLYVFIANIMEAGNSTNWINCAIRKNGNDFVYMGSWQGKIDDKSVTSGWGTATGAATLHLVKGDRVDTYCYMGSGSTVWRSSFTGFLVGTD